MEQLNQVLLRDDIRVGADLDAWLARGGGEGLANWISSTTMSGCATTTMAGQRG
jgi:NADH-quinone oxidoreductase subunit F